MPSDRRHHSNTMHLTIEFSQVVVHAGKIVQLYACEREVHREMPQLP